jgi:hypothetical protein
MLLHPLSQGLGELAGFGGGWEGAGGVARPQWFERGGQAGHCCSMLWPARHDTQDLAAEWPDGSTVFVGSSTGVVGALRVPLAL